jgi:hypothetical protein
MGDRLGRGTMVASYHLTPFFRVEPRDDFGRAHQVAEEHGQMAAFPRMRTFGSPGGLETLPSNGVPHFPQKFDDGGFSAPHLGQCVVSAFPQCTQKLLPGGLLVPHFEQRIGLPERAKRGSMYH